MEKKNNVTESLNLKEEFSSFKDPDALVFYTRNGVYRKILDSYKEAYDRLMTSGLYEKLIAENLIISHVEIKQCENGFYKIIKPEKVFISYPWEWSFSQLKDAALATLKIQKIALKYGMSLKDANFFNIQFYKGKPLLIDTASFELYTEGETWCAYRQFCTNFLSSLALMSHTDLRLSSLLIRYIEGIPLDLASKLLPLKTCLNLRLLSHIHLHSKFQEKFSENKKKIDNLKISKEQQIALIDDLTACIFDLSPCRRKSEWKDYYSSTNYCEEGFEKKKEIIKKYKDLICPEKVWDFGGNTGIFSRIFSNSGIETVSFDIDENAVEISYIEAKARNEENILPLIIDLRNPSPSLGFAGKERKSLAGRAENIDLILALALVHHLRFTYNIPFSKAAEFFVSLAPKLIVEFVPKDDSQVRKMLLNRKDVFDDYSIENFEKEFQKHYRIVSKNKIEGTKRTLYLMEVR